MFNNIIRKNFNRIINPDHTTIKITARNETSTLTKILNSLQELNLDYTNIESKTSELNKNDEIPKVNFYITYKNKENIYDKINSIILKNGFSIQKNKIPKIRSFPLNINELNESGKILFDLDGDHDFFTDKEYKKRIDFIKEQINDYKIGDKIPTIEYIETELNTWRNLYTDIKPKLLKNGCKEYIESFTILEDEGIFSPDFIPQLEDISNFLKKKSGLTIKPVKGIVSQKEYFEILAYRKFSSTQYLRHHSDYTYTPEPDITHELLGHVPMFCNNDYCDISQKLGLLSLGKSDLFIKQIGSLYWYSIEFGLVKENNNKKIFGGGIMSSVTEVENSMKCEDIRIFDSEVVSLDLDLLITDLQKYYYIADSLKDINEKLDDFKEKKRNDFNLSINKDNNKIYIDRQIEQINN